MREDILSRIVDEANYIADTGATVRKAAKVFHFSKSTVHKDVTERLKIIDKELYKKVKKVLDKNLAERHIRGGEATRKKYSR
ncbi:MAG: sporulation transcriptional regulator SpoIIID [Clostridia bacterium]|nr:sporulation transcriptional regulator SpoIIID [Clostridia bacterium]MBR2448955.1 sporulation transcriptional regulator SpoIIID [Clostridia bacterium]